MAERTYIPSSPACGQWETLLADALDGLLEPADEATFSAHMAGCPACTALFEEARRGREWLEFLAPEPEVPGRAAGQDSGRDRPRAGGRLRPGRPAGGRRCCPCRQPWQRPGFMGYIRRFAEPRLMMTAAMAFFSIALTLNLTGVRLTDLRLADLRPIAVRSFMERRLTMASTPIIRYYDHCGWSTKCSRAMRELRRQPGQGEGGENRQRQNTQPVTPGESQAEYAAHKDGGSRVDPPQQSGVPADSNSDYLETAFFVNDPTLTPATQILRRAIQTAHCPSDQDLSPGPSHSGGSAAAVRERSTVWTA